MYRRQSVGAFLVLAVLFGGGFFLFGGASTAELEVGTLAPALEVTRPDGEAFRLEELSARAVLVAFWASYDPHCDALMPVLTELERAYDGKGLAVVAVALDKPEGREYAMKSFFKGISRPQNLVMAGESTVETWELSKVPTLYLLTAEGRIAAAHLGKTSTRQLREGIDAVLAYAAEPQAP